MISRTVRHTWSRAPGLLTRFQPVASSLCRYNAADVGYRLLKNAPHLSVMADNNVLPICMFFLFVWTTATRHRIWQEKHRDLLYSYRATYLDKSTMRRNGYFDASRALVHPEAQHPSTSLQRLSLQDALLQFAQRLCRRRLRRHEVQDVAQHARMHVRLRRVIALQQLGLQSTRSVGRVATWSTTNQPPETKKEEGKRRERGKKTHHQRHL